MKTSSLAKYKEILDSYGATTLSKTTLNITTFSIAINETRHSAQWHSIQCYMDKLQLTGQNWAEFSTLEVAICMLQNLWCY
jgi:hypothetical protein